MNALLDILVLGFRGRIVRRVRRLRDPRQLLALLAGLAYFAWFAVRPFLFGFRHGGGPGIRIGGLPLGAGGRFGPLIQLAVALGLAAVALLTWIFTSSRPAFRFTEAEIHLLLPAPLSRRQILRFALLKQQTGILVGALVFLFFSAMRGAAAPAALLLRFAVYWGLLTLLDLYTKGVSLWKARAAELPVGTARRQRALAAVLGLAWATGIAAGLWLAWRATIARLATIVDRSAIWRELPATALAFAGAVRDGVAGWLLAPFLWIAAPLAAAGAARLGGALFLAVLIAAHYEWVMRSSARFEETALERARRQAMRGGRRQRYQGQSQAARERAPFRLEAAGAPELAITWKNLILRGRTPLARQALYVLAVLAVLALGMAAAGALGLPAPVIGGMVGGVGLFLLTLLPLMAGLYLRNDLRVDFLHLEILRAWPIAGWRVILAEILAPAAALVWVELLSAGLVVSAAAAIGWTAGAQHVLTSMIPAPHAVRGILATSLAATLAGLVILGLAVGLYSLTLQNLAVLLLPGWVPLGFNRRRGTAVFGQNLVVGVGHLLGMIAGALLPLAVAGGLAALLHLGLGLPFTAWEAPLLALAAALPFAGEAYVMIRFAGYVWDRLDPSQEMLDPVS